MLHKTEETVTYVVANAITILNNKHTTPPCKFNCSRKEYRLMLHNRGTDLEVTYRSICIPCTHGPE